MSISTSGKITQYFPLKIDFELDCCINGAKIYTTESLPHLEEEVSKSESYSKSFLAIEICSKLDTIDSYHDGNLHIRATILIFLSIISYLLDHPLTVYQASSSFGAVEMDSVERFNKIEVSKFMYSRIDKSSDLLKILEAIYLRGKDINQFVVSALSRWHKARYLEEESEANLYDEEGFLVYFHIMELCSNYYNAQQISEAQDQIKSFTKGLLSNTLKLRDSHLAQVSQEKYKAVRSILLSDGHISITSKICYFLEQVNLLDPKTQYFVEKLVKIRNTIAHGCHVNHTELNWPLPPFLPINPDAERYIFEIRTFTGRVIGAFLGIETWSEIWENIHTCLHPPAEYIKNFIRNKSFEVITSADFIKGKIDGVRPSSLVEQFLLKKINFQEIEVGLSLFLFDTKVDEYNAVEIFEAAIILADSSDKNLADKCKNIVADIHKNELGIHSNIKDVLREIECQAIKPLWFRRWIENGECYKD
jgi:hypothetical protein